MHLGRQMQRKQGCLLRQWWQVELAERGPTGVGKIHTIKASSLPHVFLL